MHSCPMSTALKCKSLTQHLHLMSCLETKVKKMHSVRLLGVAHVAHQWRQQAVHLGPVL